MSALLVAFLALTACGASGDREELESVIQTSMIDTPPGSCLKFGTLRFLESTTHREGQAAVDACEEEAPDSLAEQPTKVDVGRMDLDGDSATAVIAFKGSLLDDQKIEYAFVDRGSGWKFDKLLGFVDLDSAHLIMRMGREGLLRAKSPQEAENIACWIGRMERMSDSALEELVFGDAAESSQCAAESRAI